MLISLSWLREFVPYEGGVQDLGDRLTMLGLELEGVHDPFEGIAQVVVGHVAECARHPESDHLSVCSVDIGAGELLSIVCGAPNVAAGQKVPVAPVGSTLPGGLQIKKAKLRGVPSMGMICSERELGLSEAHEGILVLPDTCRVGLPLTEALNLERTVLDISITPNRADCLSVLGIARETALAFGLPLTMPPCGVEEGGAEAAGLLRVEIADGEFCPLYQARLLSGVRMGKAPDWMRYRLTAIGLRPISNIVDVTNYVMMELGQPLHAFDRNLLAGGVIRVAPASDGTRFTTLDGQERKLLASDLLIWDGEKPVALAGVMGGLNSEIGDATTEVALECAVFRPGAIRRTARRLALPSEASYRFERGVDQIGARLAVDRAARLMAEVSGATVLRGVVAAEPKPWTTRVHGFRLGRCNDLLGLELTPDFARETFSRMGCAVDESDPSRWSVTTPPWRLDLEREVDLSEELARVYGVDRIPAVLPRVAKSLDIVDGGEGEFAFNRRIKAWASGVGLREVVNYSFVGHKDLDLLCLENGCRIAIANPLTEEQNVLRTAVAPSLLQNLKHNIAQGNARLRLFELARVYFEDQDSETRAREHTRLGLLLHGTRFAEDWPWPLEDADYLDVKGLVEGLFEHLKLGRPEFAALDSHCFLEPAVSVILEGTVLGSVGRVKADMADAHHARREVWLADLDVDLIRGLHAARKVVFRPLPTFPPVRRDVTVACPGGLAAESVRRAILELKPQFLESVEMVNLFTPDHDKDERNLTFRLTYRHAARTLKDKEVDKEHGTMVDGLLQKLPVRL
ncbi:phenylalanine--tRNA ligase subunit beta [Desulfovibrio aminophilus]|nr:phenylalanine--tRNA ligase subunit beta [Desulfovibrio aminophilus]MCM0755251.1 phenylalanine--tRNA ligase subunit beta [Desulfovibrio aminophilus]